MRRNKMRTNGTLPEFQEGAIFRKTIKQSLNRSGGMKNE